MIFLPLSDLEWAALTMASDVKHGEVGASEVSAQTSDGLLELGFLAIIQSGNHRIATITDAGKECVRRIRAQKRAN